MKRLPFAVALAALLFLGACADPLEQRDVQDTQDKFQRGIRGQGQLVPIDQSDDPNIKPPPAGL